MVFINTKKSKDYSMKNPVEKTEKLFHSKHCMLFFQLENFIYHDQSGKRQDNRNYDIYEHFVSVVEDKSTY